jgi:hypothetical protein
MQIGKDEYPHGSIFRPRRNLLPRKILLDALRPSLITAPVSFLELQHPQSPEVFLEGLPNQCRSIHFLALGCDVRGLQEFCVENNLDGFHCGVLYTVYWIVVV